MNRHLRNVLAGSLAAMALAAVAPGVTHADPLEHQLSGALYVNGDLRIPSPDQGRCYRIDIDEGDFLVNQVPATARFFEAPNCQPWSQAGQLGPYDRGGADDPKRSVKWV
jgi:hypothetical protein